jgi:GNAT superfamily N-acetyltransferase
MPVKLPPVIPIGMSDSLAVRFDQLTDQVFAQPLCGRYRVRRVTDDAEWQALFTRIRDAAFPQDKRVDWSKVYDDEQRARIDALGQSLGAAPLRHRLAITDGDEIVGCYCGEQDGSARYYMMYTTVLPSHQGRGIYKDMLARLVAIARDTGFVQIWSRHHADNNQVLVPKLKAGFVIAAFEVAPNYGLLVHLRRYLNDALESMYHYRVDAASHAAAIRTVGILKDD